MHLDMDAFFASIEERERPELKGKPIVVGADPKGGNGRGVVSTASYAARKFGIGSGLPISKAWQFCPAPACAYLPVDGKLYEIVSERIMKVVRECVQEGANYESVANLRISNSEIRKFGSHSQFAPIEQVSIDEAYVEIKNEKCKMKNCWKDAEKLAHKIKLEILKREKLTCSIGIGPNKLIAKIASDFKKPDGLTIVRPGEVQEFLDPMPVRKLPGVGPKTEMELQGMGIRTVGELRQRCDSIVGRGLVPRRGGGRAPTLQHWSELFQKAQGIDDFPVVEEDTAKSLGREITFDKDTRDQALLTRTLMDLCEEVSEEVRREEVQFRTITLRIRFDNFETHTSAHSLKKATVNDTILKRETLKLLYPYFKKKRLIRLLGVRVSNLT